MAELGRVKPPLYPGIIALFHPRHMISNSQFPPLTQKTPLMRRKGFFVVTFLMKIMQGNKWGKLPHTFEGV
jgi:hypothetical protein